MKKIIFFLVAVSMSLSVAATRYVKVTSASDLASGDVVVMANETAGKISSAVASTGKYIEATAATIADGVAEADGATEITLTASGSSWKLKVGTKTIGNNNNVDLNVEGKGSTTYNISFDDFGNAVIANTVASNGTFYYNGSGSGRFKTYTSTSMSKIQLYKKVAGSNPVLTLSATSLAFDTRALANGTATDSKTLTISASDLKQENITVAMQQGSVFSVTPATVASTGGTVTISYTATAEGTFTDTVVVTGKSMTDEVLVRKCAVSVTINAAAPTGTNVTYNLLQNLSDLNEGDKVFFTPDRTDADYVLGLYNYSVASSNIRGAAATFDAARHQVTASDLYAYRVHIVDGKYQFIGSDGKYLYMYNTNKNLSSTDTDSTSNKAKWTMTITDDVATIKSVYSSSWVMLYNHTATSPLFCTYQGKDSNTDYLKIYSNNAPAYQEKVLHPAMEVKLNGVLLGDTLDWGEVVYDNSWGTEAAPYSEMKSLTVTGTDLPTTISIAVTGAQFSSMTSSLPATGGSLSVNFEANSTGTYWGTLTISCDTLQKTVVLKAKAVTEATPDPTTLPNLTVSTNEVALDIVLTETTSDMDMFTFSATNLAKPLYVKWNKNNTEPTAGMGAVELLVGEQGIGAGETAQFAAPTVATTEVYVSATGYTPYTYSSTLHFYSYKADSKTEYAIDTTVPFTVTVTNTPTGLTVTDVKIAGQKVVRNGRVVILLDGKTYDMTGKAF